MQPRQQKKWRVDATMAECSSYHEHAMAANTTRGVGWLDANRKQDATHKTGCDKKA